LKNFHPNEPDLFCQCSSSSPIIYALSIRLLILKESEDQEEEKEEMGKHHA
jgi:hypothetical protein